MLLNQLLDEKFNDLHYESTLRKGKKYQEICPTYMIVCKNKEKITSSLYGSNKRYRKKQG